MTIWRLVLFLGAVVQPCLGDDAVFPGADERTPSRAYYFDWINSQYEGSTEAQTLTNLEFFQWMHDTFGMALDIYSLDVGNIDDGPYTAGVGRFIPVHCGTLDSPEFKEQFPRGFDPIARKAASFGCRLGIWLAPDGFGDTVEEEQARVEMLVKLCRDYHFMLLKLDSVAGGLRPEKQETLARALEACRKHCPDLIVLNERIDLGKAEPHATTYLWEGVETYIDVFCTNQVTAPHHRAHAMARETTPGLSRLIEDHGVCFSSCLDYWEDDLVLQCFNRSLIMAPEIYGSPWLLRDDELPRLARLCNLHRKYRAILVDGILLPEERYGPHAVARGDGSTRLITLRNLTWETVRYSVQLDASIGLASDGEVEVRRFHPYERILGRFRTGDHVEVEVPPFRACLLLATTEPVGEPGVTGCDYEVIPSRPGVIRLLGLPGTRAAVKLVGGPREGAFEVAFPGTPLKRPWHRKLGDLAPCAVPPDAEALYEATCFAADSNALEVRSLLRSGPTKIPQVEAARRAFFEQPMFRNRAIWDRNLFDGRLDTFFIARYGGGALRIDLGDAVCMEELVIQTRSRYEHDLNPELHNFAKDCYAEASADFMKWIPIGSWSGKGTVARAKMPDEPVRYVRIHGAPRRIAEIGGQADRTRWRASNLLPVKKATHAWSLSLTLDEVPGGSYLAVALEGRHGVEGAYAALRVDSAPVGAPDRSVSYPSNTWEYYNEEKESNYTYYIPLDEAMAGKPMDVVVLVMEGGANEFQPAAYITAYPPPFESKEIILH